MRLKARSDEARFGAIGVDECWPVSCCSDGNIDYFSEGGGDDREERRKRGKEKQFLEEYIRKYRNKSFQACNIAQGGLYRLIDEHEFSTSSINSVLLFVPVWP